mmetsp:Transcript_110807/g.192070  ORF Transcript_110807/g.192070 Transcript_110807/m.192070 type:complete len:238 (+) Transcript_110807:1797-2510(+)
MILACISSCLASSFILLAYACSSARRALFSFVSCCSALRRTRSATAVFCRASLASFSFCLFSFFSWSTCDFRCSICRCSFLNSICFSSICWTLCASIETVFPASSAELSSLMELSTGLTRFRTTFWTGASSCSGSSSSSSSSSDEVPSASSCPSSASSFCGLAGPLFLPLPLPLPLPFCLPKSSSLSSSRAPNKSARSFVFLPPTPPPPPSSLFCLPFAGLALPWPAFLGAGFAAAS